MRSMSKQNGKWVTEHPENLSAWLRANDGLEAVVIDDETRTYFCSRPEITESFEAAWKKEAKKNDKRKVGTFSDLDRMLFAQELAD